MRRLQGGWLLESRGEGSREAEEEGAEDELGDVSVSQEVDGFQVVEQRRGQGLGQVSFPPVGLLCEWMSEQVFGVSPTLLEELKMFNGNGGKIKLILGDVIDPLGSYP